LEARKFLRGISEAQKTRAFRGAQGHLAGLRARKKSAAKLRDEELLAAE
jgi:hypothetical protein